MIKDFIVALIGIISGIFLLYKIPRISSKGILAVEKTKDIFLSIIIPCRNEENNIKELLNSLMGRTYKNFEVICVNDQSTDSTQAVIESFGVKLLNITNKPNDWNGKPWALQQGAAAASGNVYLFLDADLKLNNDALDTLATYYKTYGNLSVQPFHKTANFNESLSIIFNLVSVAGTGIALPKKRVRGMFGPVIMIDKDTYTKHNGHESVKKSVIEDYDLGMYYKNKKVDYSLFVGNKSLSFRMYPDGIKSQFFGFTKNLSQGALSSGLVTFILTFLWIMSLTSIPIVLITTLVSQYYLGVFIFAILYTISALFLYFKSKLIGKYNIFAIILYPIPLIWFLFIMLTSFILKIFFKKVYWKGRWIKI